jgi:hypothetical protein
MKAVWPDGDGALFKIKQVAQMLQYMQYNSKSSHK